jgi:hypothetical protein
VGNTPGKFYGFFYEKFCFRPGDESVRFNIEVDPIKLTVPQNISGRLPVKATPDKIAETLPFRRS